MKHLSSLSEGVYVTVLRRGGYKQVFWLCWFSLFLFASAVGAILVECKTNIYTFRLFICSHGG